MNKLCSRNTALATAAGRSGCAPVVSQPLAVFSPFDVLVRFTLSFVLFIFLLLLSLSLFCISVLSMLKVSLSRSRRIGVSHSSSLSLSLRLTSFILNYVTANFRNVSPLFRSLCFFFASVNDPGVSLRPHSTRGLYYVHALELRRELQPRRARAGEEFLARYLALHSVGVPATEQISNK